MIHIVLDTNIFSANRRRDSGPFRALVRLCKSGKVKLHMPYIVKHEFLSQQKQQTQKLMNETWSAASQLTGITSDPTIHKFANNTKTDAENLKDKAVDLVQKEWEKWLKEIGTAEYAIDSSHGERVMSDYFAGGRPFKAAKNRNDIPDSFAWHSICDLSKKYQPLHVVTNDSSMYETAATVKEIVPYKSLAAFIETLDCQKALGEIAEEVVAKNVRRAGALLPNLVPRLQAAVSDEIVSALDSETVNDSSIPDDNHQGMIFTVDEPSELNFDFGKIEYYGDSEIGVPFVAVTECELNYAIYKGDYYGLDDRKRKRISIGERNEHYYDADEVYPIRVYATLQIKLDTEELRNEKLKRDELEELFDDAYYTINVGLLEVA